MCLYVICIGRGLIVEATMTSASGQSILFQTTNERPEPIEAEMRGNIPSWLSGTLIRNGPGRFECGDTSFNHWFDGQALLHRFHVQDGNVTYSSKFVRSESYADSLNRRNACHLEFGSFVPPDPCQNIFARFFSRFWRERLPADNTCVNVYPMKNKFYATTESQFLFQIDPKTLETLKRVDQEKEFPGNSEKKLVIVCISSRNWTLHLLASFCWLHYLYYVSPAFSSLLIC